MNIARRARNALGTSRARRRPEGGGARPRQRPSAPVTGMVEEFSRRLVVGWVSVPSDHPAVRIELCVGGTPVSTTTAHPGALSGVTSVLREGTPDDEQQAAAELVHPWQVPMVPGPPDDRRNSRQEIRMFSFRVVGLWAYLSRSSRVTLRVAGGRPLPIHRHGMYLSPPRNGRFPVAELHEKLANGYVLSQTGQVQLSRKLDTAWQQGVLAIHRRIHEVVRDELGIDTFLIYGTLLGIVREGGYIAHDVDFDTAYLSRERTPEAAAAEFEQVALRLIAAGLQVEAHRTALHVCEPEDDSLQVDLFHLYVDESDEVQFPFGVAGTSTLRGSTSGATTEVDVPGGRALVPANAEEWVAHIYGDDWRQPRPGFNWNLDRTRWAPQAHLSPARISSLYWADFYARHEFTAASSFCEFLLARDDLPATVVDLGCGDGRDSCGFGAAGREVVGLDRSAVGIEHARGRAEALGLADRVRFVCCDAADRDQLHAAVSEVIERTDGPVLLYLRFFLHAIPEDVQDGVLATLGALVRPGDVLAAEFRTESDEATTKTHGGHYRRYQDGWALAERLRTEHGFAVLHAEEGTGLSPYGDEDPVLFRLLVRRDDEPREVTPARG